MGKERANSSLQGIEGGNDQLEESVSGRYKKVLDELREVAMEEDLKSLMETASSEREKEIMRLTLKGKRIPMRLRVEYMKGASREQLEGMLEFMTICKNFETSRYMDNER